MRSHLATAAVDSPARTCNRSVPAASARPRTRRILTPQSARPAGQKRLPVRGELQSFDKKARPDDRLNALPHQRRGKLPPAGPIGRGAVEHNQRQPQVDQPAHQLVASRGHVAARVEQQLAGRRPGVAGQASDGKTRRPADRERQRGDRRAPSRTTTTADRECGAKCSTHWATSSARLVGRAAALRCQSSSQPTAAAGAVRPSIRVAGK